MISLAVVVLSLHCFMFCSDARPVVDATHQLLIAH